MELISRISLMQIMYPVWYVRFAEGMAMPLFSWVFTLLDLLQMDSIMGCTALNLDLGADSNLQIYSYDLFRSQECMGTITLMLCVFGSIGIMLLHLAIIAFARFCLTSLLVLFMWKSLSENERNARIRGFIRATNLFFVNLYWVLFANAAFPLTLGFGIQMFGYWDDRPLPEQILITVAAGLYVTVIFVRWIPYFRKTTLRNEDGLSKAAFIISGLKPSFWWFPFLQLFGSVLDAAFVLLGRWLRSPIQWDLILVLALSRALAFFVLRPLKSRRDILTTAIVYLSDVGQLCLIMTLTNIDDRTNPEMGKRTLVLSIWQMCTVLVVTVFSLFDMIAAIAEYLLILYRILLKRNRQKEKVLSEDLSVMESQQKLIPPPSDSFAGGLKMMPFKRPITDVGDSRVHPGRKVNLNPLLPSPILFTSELTNSGNGRVLPSVGRSLPPMQSPPPVAGSSPHPLALFPSHHLSSLSTSRIRVRQSAFEPSFHSSGLASSTRKS
eukprot:ANDGO_02708.mRNA.1 hypothetical protein